MYGTYLREHEIFQASGVDYNPALEVSTGDKAYFTVVKPITIVEFGIMPTVAFNYNVQTTEGVVALDRQPTYGSDTGRVEIATVKLTDGTAIGKLLKKVFNPVNADPGSRLVLEVKTQAAGGGGIAGDWIAYFLYYERGEVDASLNIVPTRQ